MTDSKQNKSETLSLGILSVFRTLVELDRTGATNLSLDDAVVAQREQGDKRVTNALDAIREHTGSVAARRGR